MLSLICIAMESTFGLLIKFANSLTKMQKKVQKNFMLAIE